MQYDFFNWLFQLKSDQILFVLVIIIITVATKKLLQIMEDKSKKLDKKDEKLFELMEEQSKKLDKKDEKILELIEKVNNTQIEIVKTMESIKSKSEFDLATITAEFKLLRNKMNQMDNKIDEVLKIFLRREN